MKKSLLSIALTSLLATSAVVSTQASATGIEGLSANVGAVSQYIFRGIEQTSTASASAGLDYQLGNFSVGTWAADVDDGLEIDFYGSYAFELVNGLGLSAGFTTYQYTGDFDSAYNEVNLGLSYGMFSVSYNIGQQEEDTGLGIAEADYDFLAVTVEHEGFYGTYGTWGDEIDGDYIELGFGTEVASFDLGVALIANSKELNKGKADESLVFSIGKTF